MKVHTIYRKKLRFGKVYTLRVSSKNCCKIYMVVITQATHQHVNCYAHVRRA